MESQFQSAKAPSKITQEERHSSYDRSYTTSQASGHSFSSDNARLEPQISIDANFSRNKESIADVKNLAQPFEEVAVCNLCGQDIIKKLVYTNACGHNFCYYCLTDLIDAHPGLKFCFLKKCPRNMNQTEIKRFLEKCNNQEKLNKQPSMAGVPEEGPINMHPQNVVTSVTRNNRVNDGLVTGLNQSSPSNLVNQAAVCNLCAQEITKKLVYTNACGHNYCYYCLTDAIDAHSGMKFCFLKKCPKNISQNELRRFLDECNHKYPSVNTAPAINARPQKISTIATQNNIAPKVPFNLNQTTTKAKCTMCLIESNKANPIVYTNDPCNHSFCKNCISDLFYDGICLKPKCDLPLSFEKLKGALTLSGVSSFLVKCNKCDKNVDARKIFINPSCQHRFCLSCTQTAKNVYCLVSTCPVRIDEEALFTFTVGRIAQEEFQSSEKKAVASPPSIPSFSNQKNGIQCDKIGPLTVSNASISKAIRPEVQPLEACLEKNMLYRMPTAFKSCLPIICQTESTFFMLGLLLVQDILSQPPSDDIRHLQESIMSSFKSSQLKVNIEELDVTNCQKLLEEVVSVSQFIGKSDSLDSKDRSNIANFIMQQCIENTKVGLALEQLGRCTLINYMITQELNKKIPSLFKKLTGSEWKTKQIDQEDLFSLFCDNFDYKFRVFCEENNKFCQKVIGQEHAKYKADLLDLQSGKKFRAILYHK